MLNWKPDISTLVDIKTAIESDVIFPNVNEALPEAKSTVVQSSLASNGLPLVSDTIKSSIHNKVFPLPLREYDKFVKTPLPAGILSPVKEKPITIPRFEVDTWNPFCSAKPPEAPLRFELIHQLCFQS